MLRSLSIRNFALIERADLEFSEKINVLSGETGAGKSVILDAIDFVLGAKADKSVIRHGESECTVRAEFVVTDPEILNELKELDVEPEETLVLFRKLTFTGGSVKLNGCAVSLSMLKKITSRLVDVHGQSEHFYLLKESNQLSLLDKIAGSEVAAQKLRLDALLKERKEKKSELSLLGGDEGERSRRLDMLRFQIDEIRRAALQTGEEEKLLLLRQKFKNAEKLSSNLSLAIEALSGDGGAEDGLRAAKKAFFQLSKLSEEYEASYQKISSLLEEAGDFSREAEEFLSELEFDESEMEKVEARLDEIGSIKKKYGGSVESAKEYLESAEREYELIFDGERRREILLSELAKNAEEVLSACDCLTNLRKRAAKGFSERVEAELKTLNISSGRFEIEFEASSDVESATRDGLGRVKFLFSANAGEPLLELGKIISGGEMSRFMLAIKAQLSAFGIGTYLFDEIDAGIGGKTAKVVAEKFCAISEHAQIVAVSHSAQIASCADRQFLIRKEEEGGRTKTKVFLLSRSERVEELARLIAGEKGELSLKQAEEFLENFDRYKKEHTV